MWAMKLHMRRRREGEREGGGEREKRRERGGRRRGRRREGEREEEEREKRTVTKYARCAGQMLSLDRDAVPRLLTFREISKCFVLPSNQ